MLQCFVQCEVTDLSVCIGCVDKKGGELASAVHSYMQHGDSMIRSLVQHTLAIVSLLTYFNHSSHAVIVAVMRYCMAEFTLISCSMSACREYNIVRQSLGV